VRRPQLCRLSRNRLFHTRSHAALRRNSGTTICIRCAQGGRPRSLSALTRQEQYGRSGWSSPRNRCLRRTHPNTDHRSGARIRAPERPGDSPPGRCPPPAERRPSLRPLTVICVNSLDVVAAGRGSSSCCW
jgi:hypothetical protein